MYIPLLSANVFHIQKIKKRKEGMSEKKKQRTKRIKKCQKR